MQSEKKSSRSSSKPAKEDVAPEGEMVTLTMKDLQTAIDSSVKKAMASFRDDIMKLLDDRLQQTAIRVTAIEATNLEQDKRILDLEQSLNVVTERCLALESKLDNTEKSMEKFSDSSIDKLQGQIKDNMSLTNDVEQYSRRLNIRIHGLSSNDDDDDNPINTVISFLRNKLHVDCELDDIEAAHPLPARPHTRPSTASHTHPTRSSFIVRFRRNQKRLEILLKRRLLKGSGLSISEDLTALNSQLLNRLNHDDRIQSAWSWNGHIYAVGKNTGGKKFVIKPFSLIDGILAKFTANSDN